jgi:putative FmdB family regulatory protein
MPFYEYECQACKYYAEVMQKITDAPLVKCPSCGKRRLKKLVSAPVFRLKGGGWYETDFKSDQETKRNLSGADKEESKPDAKPDSADTKVATQDAKETKDSKEPKGAKEAKEAKDTKETKETKAAEPKGSAERTAASSRADAARRTTRTTRSKVARKRRR